MQRAVSERGNLALFTLPLRPFFLGAGCYGLLVIPIWLWMVSAGGTLSSPLPPSLWHGHEMLFGYASAALAGFLLTAAPSWSGRAALRGWSLAGLFSLWLAGRFAAWFGGSAPLSAAIVDLAFLPVLGLVLIPYLMAAGRHNLVFLIILGLLTAAEAMAYLDALGWQPAWGEIGLRLGVETFVLMVAIVGGRVTRAFTANAIGQREGRSVRDTGMIDRIAVLSIVALILADLTVSPEIAGAVALVAAALNFWRMLGWQTLQTRHEPLLWVLHLGYIWMIVGLLAVAYAALLDPSSTGDALHVLTIGAIGTMTVAIMTRAALGHTGRPLTAGRLTVAIYCLLSLAALARVAPMFWPTLYQASMMVSGLAWTLAFLAFSCSYGAILLQRRVDAD